MKKYIYKIFIFMCLMFIVTLVGCSDNNDELTLRVYNSQDYIDEGLDDAGNKVTTSVIEDWQEDYFQRTGKRVEVIYDTFETNETMLNTLKTGKTTYDLCCPSEYVVQKMIREGMIEKYDYSIDSGYLYIDNYNQYASPYIKSIFNSSGLADYAIPYMWGTLGLLYNVDLVDSDDVETWGVLWNSDYKNMASAKDSVRDTYVAGVMYLNHDKLMEYRDKYLSGELSSSEYNALVSSIMNDTSDISSVEAVLKEMKQNIFGFEVDSGKNDIVTGKISINVAWSGDAVYSMQTAYDEEGVTLNYIVPLEGGNVWFDAWVMPKGANKELAQDFVNYLCHPSVASQNMEYIGYTSPIAGDDIYELALDTYGSEDGDTIVDLSYFFEGTLSEEYLVDGKAIIVTDGYNNVLDAQYPSKDVLERCAIMEDFKDRNNEVLAMWENVKLGEYSVWLTIVVIVTVVLILGIGYYVKYDKIRRKKNKKLNW